MGPFSVREEGTNITSFPIQADFLFDPTCPEGYKKAFPLLSPSNTGERDQVLTNQPTPAGENLNWLRKILRQFCQEDGAIGALGGLLLNISAGRKAKAARNSAPKQAGIAAIGQMALAGTDLRRLWECAVVLVASSCDVEYGQVLELVPHTPSLRPVAGVGWKEELIGRATLSVGRDSQAGYTLLAGEPVIVKDFRTETRFDFSPVLRENGILSGISVVIGRPEEPFGVLGAHSLRPSAFSQDDVHFFHSIANVLAAATRHQRLEEAWRESEARFKSLDQEDVTALKQAQAEKARLVAAIEQSAEAVVITDVHGTIQYVNPAFTEITGYSREEALGKNPRLLKSGEHDPQFYKDLRDTILEGKV